MRKKTTENGEDSKILIVRDEPDIIDFLPSQTVSPNNNAFLNSFENHNSREHNKIQNRFRVRYLDTIKAVMQIVDAKDQYTCEHSDRVSYYCVRIGKAFNLNDSELETLCVAGLFHDVGKMGVADDILFKCDKLTPQEYDEIKKHPAKGARILSLVSKFRKVIPLVKCHHERIDGKGYPDGLTGDEIPFLAKIVSVADAFDAMTSDRRYRAKLDLDTAVNQLIYGSGTQFDSRIVEKFVNLLEGSLEAHNETICKYN